MAVSNRFDKGGGIGAPRRDWSERAKEREEGDRLAFRPSIWTRKKGGASERANCWIEKERGTYMYMYRGRKKDRCEGSEENTSSSNERVREKKRRKETIEHVREKEKV